MAEISFYKLETLPGVGSPNANYLIKAPADSRVKFYVADNAGTLFPVGLLTETDVLSTALAGYSVGSDTALSSADSILHAFQKVQGQLNALSTSVSQGMRVPLPLDCSANPDYPAAEAGDSYKVTVAGRIGGASGPLVQAGDLITASTDNGGGTHAAVGSQWFILQANTDNATELVTGLTRIADSAEVIAGTEAFAYVTPLRLKGRLDLKQDVITGGASTITGTDLTINRALMSNGSGKVVVSAVTSTELGHLSGVTSPIQTQLDSRVSGSGAATQVAIFSGAGTVAGTNEFTYNSTTKVLDINGTTAYPKIQFRATTLTSSISEITRDTGKFVFRNVGAFDIELHTTNILRWSVLASGMLQANGPQTIQSSSGVLTLQPSGSFTSGINATANINMYSNLGSGIIRNTVATGLLGIFGGDASANGGNILLYGPTHATLADTIELRIGATPEVILSGAIVDIPTNYLQARGGITNIVLGQSPVSTGPVLTHTLTNGGSGYVNGSYANVALTAVGNQSGALFDITVAGGVVTVATLKHAGRRYAAGSVHTISNILLGGAGSGLIITVDTVQGADAYIGNVTGSANGSILRLENIGTSAGSNTLIGQVLFSHLDNSIFASGDRAAVVARSLGVAGGGYIDLEASAEGFPNRVVSMRVLNSAVRFQDGTAAIPSISFINDGDNGFYLAGTNIIGVSTAGTLRWSVLADGTLEGNGARVLRTSTGDLTIATAAGNGNILLTPHGAGRVRLAGTIDNAVGNFATYSATGVLQQRTAAEVLADIGAQASGSYVPTSRAINTNNGITGGGNLSADRTLGLTGLAFAFHNLASDGFAVRTTAGTAASRTLTGSDSIEVTGGDGVAGNPVFKMKYASTPEW